MARAMERHEVGEAPVIPVILHACDWHSTPFGKLLAAKQDGRRISEWPDRNEAFLDVVKAVRQVATELSAARGEEQASTAAPAEPASPPLPSVADFSDPPRSSNLRIRRIFSDRDRDKLERDAFEFIANFFESSMNELSERNPGVQTDFQRVDARRFLCAAYADGVLRSEMTVWHADRRSFGGGIAYLTQRTTDSDTVNGSLSVQSDGHMLYLSALMLGIGRTQDTEKLTFQGAAELFWGVFIEPLQR